MKTNHLEPEKLIDALRSSKKYRDLDLPYDFLHDILVGEPGNSQDASIIEAKFRKKVHEVIAPYLETINYTEEAVALQEFFQEHPPSSSREYCISILSRHSSTRERLQHLDQLYPALFAITGKPGLLVDLACGLNPFSLPWMGLDTSTRYFAYDIHKPRVDLINQFFSVMGFEQLAMHQDFLLHPPAFQPDVTFIFKEIHRIQKRKAGAVKAFLSGYRSDWVILSLPDTDLKGHHDLRSQHRLLVDHCIPENYNYTHDLSLGSETFYFLRLIDG